MLKFNMFLPKPLIQWFRARAKKEGVSASEVVRRALGEYKEREEKKEDRNV